MKPLYPKNKGHFIKLVDFAKEIIAYCNDNHIVPVIYGSFAHFYYTQDHTMNVNDIDIMFSKNDLKKLHVLLKKKKIKFVRCSSQDYSMILKRGNCILELDEIGEGYKYLNEQSLSRSRIKNFTMIDFYGIKVPIITLKQLENIYSVAYNRSREDKAKILNKIHLLEKFIKRKINSDVKVYTRLNKHLSNFEKNLINKHRLKEFGKGNEKDFTKDYEPETLWFFVTFKSKIVSLGGIRPLHVAYRGKKFSLGGICSIISIIKGKGYGKILMSFMVDYSINSGKTILGFTEKEAFFRKSYLKTKKHFIRRFIYINPKTKEETLDKWGDGIFYEGKDKMITKILRTKEPVYINVPHW